MTLAPIAPAELAEPAPRPGQVEIDPTATCAAPLCGIPVIGHIGTPYAVDGFPVGSASCADRLHRARRDALACCYRYPWEPDTHGCGCARFAAAVHNAFHGTPLVFAAGGAR